MASIVSRACSAVTLFALLACALADEECNNRGMKGYIGPNNRFICDCYKGWAGPTCNELASPLFKPCKAMGQQGTCADGLQCATWSDGVDRCTCDPDSPNPACSEDALSGCGEGCDDGFECKQGSANSFCACAPFSTQAVCQCDGTFGDNDAQCGQGTDGFCSAIDTGDACYLYPMVAFGVGPSACPTGKSLNAQGICVCVPLSTNPDCVKSPTTTTSKPQTTNTDSPPTTGYDEATDNPLPPPAPAAPQTASSASSAAGNVCVKMAPGCEKAYNVKYWVFQPGETVTKGKAKVDPRKNTFSTMRKIKAGQRYEICVTPGSPGTMTFKRQGCTRVPSANTCCKPVTARAGKALKGCADMSKNFQGVDC